MSHSVTFNQITLITDGYSNQGVPPEYSARKAFEQGITVNVIGITEHDDMESRGKIEIEAIAKEGGGLSQIVPIEKVAKTVQLVTRKAMNKTIQQAINTQLVQILGQSELTSLPPLERIKVAEMMDNLAEHSDLNILLLIDQSSSMVPKMYKVKEAIRDFQLSLQARSGNSRVAIATFPGITDFIDVKIPWTYGAKNIEPLIYNLNPKGNTPTGPAISAGTYYFSQVDNNIKKKIGVFDEYII